MAILTTGIIENTPVGGVRPTTNVAVLATSETNSSFVLIEGYYVSGNTKVLYVQEELPVTPTGVVTTNYYADFDEFEFIFTTGSIDVTVSVWGKDNEGRLTTPHRVVSQELDPISTI